MGLFQFIGAYADIRGVEDAVAATIYISCGLRFVRGKGEIIRKNNKRLNPEPPMLALQMASIREKTVRLEVV